MIARILTFFKSKVGAVVLFLIGMFVAFYFIREYRERRAEEVARAKKGEVDRELIGQMAAATQPVSAEDKTSAEWVEENKLERFMPIEPPARVESKVAATPPPKPVALPALLHFYTAPKEDPKTEQPTTETPKLYAPSGTLMPCQLVITVDSSSLETPVVGFVTEDIWHKGRLIVPAGTEVHNFAKRGRTRDRIEVEGEWKLVWQDGRELQVRGVALDRDYDINKDSYGMTDGSAGIRGRIMKADEYLELKMFAATALAGASRQGKETTKTLLGSEPSNSLENAALEGASTVAERYAKLLLNEIEGDGNFVRVAAGTQFYVYTLEVLEPKLARITSQKERHEATKANAPKETLASQPSTPSTEEALKRREALLKRLESERNQKTHDKKP